MTLEEAMSALIAGWQKAALELERSAPVMALTYRQCARALEDLLEVQDPSLPTE